ncbi:hypothetical protein ACFQRC_03550 [Enterovirga sp. GCM10030262]|uniref:hypothetical protein n=1 Tax=Enterovirga sp. GCM10030262 TaxID=3273391 RepID=UPI003619FCDC
MLLLCLLLSLALAGIQLPAPGPASLPGSTVTARDLPAMLAPRPALADLRLSAGPSFIAPDRLAPFDDGPRFPDYPSGPPLGQLSFPPARSAGAAFPALEAVPPRTATRGFRARAPPASA